MNKIMFTVMLSLTALLLSGQSPENLSSAIIKKGLDSLIIEAYDTTSATWTNRLKYDYSYDACGRTTQYAECSWDVAVQEWYYVKKEEYYYNPLSQLAMQKSLSWDIPAQVWQEAIKIEWSWGTNGKVSEKHYYHYNLSISQWKLVYKEEFIYDASAVLTERYSYFWDEINSIYNMAYMDEYSYDLNGNLVMVTFFEWNSATSFFDILAKSEFTWNVINKPLTYVFYWYDQSVMLFRKHQMLEYIYDLSLNVGDVYHYNWDQSTMHWLHFYHDILVYNNNYSFDQLLLPYPILNDHPVLFLHMLEESVRKMYVNGVWKDEMRSEYYYSDKSISGISVAEQAINIRVFPNPASDRISISWSGWSGMLWVSIYDLSGSKVYDQLLMPGEELDVSRWGRGLYLYQLRDDKTNIKTGKLILR